MWVLQNDQFLGDVSDWDRGQQFGDGLFETLVVKDLHIQNLDLHAKRFHKGLQVLGITLSLEPEAFIEKQVSAVLSHANQNSGIAKIIVTRGNSSRGYKTPDGINANVICFLSPLPTFPETYTRHGIKVRTCQTLCAIQPQLAGIKHLNRLENVLAAQELNTDQIEYQEGLLFNANHQLIEGTMSNVFLELDGRLLTPSLDESGVAGTMRQRIIQLCALHKIPLDISELKQNDVTQASSMFMCNAVIGIWPVASVNNQPKKLGPFTQRLMQLI